MSEFVGALAGQTNDVEALNRYRAGILFGYISIGSWVIVYVPQIIECYQIKSGEGLSVLFIIIWMAGDITGFLAALWQHLLPTLAILAAYYTVCDAVLLVQVYWYRRRKALHPELYVPFDAVPSSGTNESTPLLEGGKTHSPRWRRLRTTLAYLGGVAFVIAFGFIAWAATDDRPSRHHHPVIPKEEWNTGAQIVGWMSAVLYLGSRIPQIFKNQETKCAGLSLMLFFFSIIGNVTYALSILIPSIEADHIYINSSFLVGSLGTIVLDFIILGQFFAYRHERKRLLVDAASECGD